MDDSVLGLLKRQVKEEITAACDALIGGAARDYAEYTGLCGQLRGLEKAARLVEEMEERLRKQLE